MKEKLFIFYPWMFGLLSGFIYFLAYSHSWKSTDATTLLLVISAAVGWSSLIFIKTGNNYRILKAYIIFSLILSAVYIELVRISPVDMVLHRVVWGVIVVAMLLLNILLNLMKKGKP